MALEITDFTPHDKGTLRGFLTIRLTTIGLEIRGACLHDKHGNRWVQLPAKPYDKPDGSQGWQPIVEFFDTGCSRQFQRQALDAFDRFQRAPAPATEF